MALSTKKDDLGAFFSIFFPQAFSKTKTNDAVSSALTQTTSLTPVLGRNIQKANPVPAGLFISSPPRHKLSFILAEARSHLPLMALQPSLHDNEDLKHKASERYDM